jgi:translation elongation factor EF-Tu-like GTPase
MRGASLLLSRLANHGALRMIRRVLPLFALIATTGAAVSAAEDTATIVSVPKEQRVRATVTLLADTGTTGKSSPVYKGYRPQVRFSGETGVISCALGLTGEKMEPGETAQVSLKCIDDFKVRMDKLEFDMFEGGRKVGRGVLHP